MSEQPQTKPLPRREEEILMRAAQGMTDKEIAADLGISPETVSTYWRRIRLRFNAVSRTEVVAIALQRRADVEIYEAHSANVELTRELEETEQTHRALAASEERWRSLVENSPDFVIEIDADGRILFVNRPLPSPWASQGSLVFALTSGPDAERLRGAVRSVFESGCPSALEFAVFPAGHSPTWLNVRIAPTGSGDAPRAIIIATDVTERVQQDDRLRFRLAFEDLVTRISSRLLNVAGGDLDEEIDRALESLGRFLGVDTTYILECDANMTVCRKTFRWSVEGAPPDPQAPTCVFSCAEYPWWAGKLRRVEIVHIPSVSHMPEEARLVRETMQARGLQSLLAVPLTVDGRPRGFIAFESVRGRRTWAEDQVTLMRVVGEMFAGALERRRTQLALEALTVRQMSLLRCAADLLEAGTETMLTERLGDLSEEFIDFDCVGLYIADAEAGGIRPVHITRSHLVDSRFETFIVPFGRGLLGYAMTTGEAVVVNNAQLDSRSVYPADVDPPLEHVICLPITLGAGRLGVILYSRFRADQPFTAEEFELSKLFARYAELAAREARR